MPKRHQGILATKGCLCTTCADLRHLPPSHPDFARATAVSGATPGMMRPCPDCTPDFPSAAGSGPRPMGIRRERHAGPFDPADAPATTSP